MKLILRRFHRYFRTLFIILSFTALSDAQSRPNVWDVLRHQFILDHEVSRPEVQQQIRWIAAHPEYIQKMTQQSEPYIYHIVTEIRKRGLPGEIALLPMIESAYDPFAYSGAGAAGLWQLMPATSTDLGIKRDWWYDGRRSIGPSTHAALNYLTYLNQFFKGNWLLAFAAYDAGENAVAKIIKHSVKSDELASFWRLKVPKETKAYVPKLLALAEVIQNPERYHVTLSDIPHTPYFEEVNIHGQIDLNRAAKMAGISYRELIKLNPGFNRWATSPHQSTKLLIPRSKVYDFNYNLANTLHPNPQFVKYVASKPESITELAKKYHLPNDMIRQLNTLNTVRVVKGQSIDFSHVKANTQYSNLKKLHQYKVLHIVQNRESFSNVARRYQVSEQQIRQWNQIPSGTPLRAGQQLVIFKPTQIQHIYKVKPGDSLSHIATNQHISIPKLLALNPQLSVKGLSAGDSIRLA